MQFLCSIDGDHGYMAARISFQDLHPQRQEISLLTSSRYKIPESLDSVTPPEPVIQAIENVVPSCVTPPCPLPLIEGQDILIGEKSFIC